jgi:ferredoxin
MSTPFGIRRRIKRLLGMPLDGETVQEEAAKAQIVVVGPTGAEQSATVTAGVTLLTAAGSLAKPISSGCSDSTCGTCRVDVLEGAENLDEQNARERATLKENGYPTNLRLACRAELREGRVKVKAFELI